MNPDTILDGMAESVAFMPDDQRTLIWQLEAIMMQSPPPAGLTATRRIAWAFALLSPDRASDFAGAIGVAIMGGATLAGCPASEAQRLAFSAITEIAKVAATFAAEQRAAALSVLH